jgi:hypothetical protein
MMGALEKLDFSKKKLSKKKPKVSSSSSEKGREIGLQFFSEKETAFSKK